jgi:dynein heavy chain
LLFRLANAEGDILENIDLIENLEYSKKISTEIKEKVEIAKVTEVMINDASEAYRPAAKRGALVFFMMIELYKVHSFYKFSLDSFVIVVNRAIDIVAERMNPKKEVKEAGEEGEQPAEEEENKEDEPLTPRSLNKRVDALIDSITFEGFNYTRRGLLERHKLLVATMLCLRILIQKKKIDEGEVMSLIKKEVAIDVPNQAESLKFLPESVWPAVKGLESIKIFANLISSMESEAL